MGKASRGRSLYKKNDPRFQAYNTCVQEVRRVEGQATNKVYWGDTAQIVKLPVKVEGPPTIHRSLLRLEDINGHHQYTMIITCVYKVAINKIKGAKQGKTIVYDNISDNLSSSDVDNDNNAPTMILWPAQLVLATILVDFCDYLFLLEEVKVSISQ